MDRDKITKDHLKKLPKKFFEHEFKIGVYSSSAQFNKIMKDRIKVMTEQIGKLGLKITFETNIEKFPTAEVVKKFSLKLAAKVVDLA